MRNLKRNFIIKIILLTVLLATIGGLLFHFVLKNYYFDSFPFLFVLFPLVSILFHFQLLKASLKSLAKFNVIFMLSFMAKFIIYTAFVAILFSADAENKNSFAVTMMLLYLIYTIFETKTILTDIKKLS